MMLNLKLRDEFLGSQMPGTAIALRRKDNTGADQRTLEENPRSKVRASAKNDKLWQPSVTAAEAGQTVYPGKDIEHVRNTLRYILLGYGLRFLVR